MSTQSQEMEDTGVPPKPDRGGGGAQSILLVDEAGNKTMLSLQNGDVIVTGIVGPNAGRSVNLTYGKWS